MKTKQIWNFKERTFTRDDLQTIIEYLERRQAFLRSEINFHEADDKAATKGLHRIRIRDVLGMLMIAAFIYVGLVFTCAIDDSCSTFFMEVTDND